MAGTPVTTLLALVYAIVATQELDVKLVRRSCLSLQQLFICVLEERVCNVR